MSVLVIGLNHKTAPVSIREQLAFSREGVATALMLLRNQWPKAEAAILSTCNRVEIMVVSDEAHPTADEVVSFIAQARDLPVPSFRHYLYELADEQAIRHVFRVASGLDSMVVGEYQIVNQLKTAYAQASEQGTTGRTLNRLFHHAFSVSKRVRNETELGRCHVSVPSVAVDVARGIFSDFASKKVLVVGAGEMAQLVCQHLRKASVQQFTVTSRTIANARALAQACEGECVPYDQMPQQLIDADIVITAVSCPKAIITAAVVREAHKQRRGRPLFILDLAVPRNVEAEVENIPGVPGVYLYDVDALGRLAEQNRQHHNTQLAQCEGILDAEVDAFRKWIDEGKVRPLIEQMYADAYELRDLELRRLLRSCPELSEEQVEAVTELTDRLINKLMHPCASTLRQHNLTPPSTSLVESLHNLILRLRGQPET
jgi:glutamyl-tRNA reductase